MTAKNQKTIIRGIVLIITLISLYLTGLTISVGIDLATISQQNADVQSWRESGGAGAIAADNVYNSNQAIRQAIYHSSNPYVRWIATTNSLVQLVVGFSLIGLTILFCYIWYLYFRMKIRNFRKKAHQRKQRQLLRRNGRTA